MGTTDRLTAAWLTAPATRNVMDALEAARPGGARFVGGCVRNTLRGGIADDIDIATQLTPDEVIAALEAAGIRAIPTGKAHGTITAISLGEPFEITTLRRDVETDGRRAIVAFTEDWAEDAARRDFTMNAIYAEADGTLMELIPGSVADAVAGRVVFIGDADERLREDYLRILRFFRFNAWYGAGVDAEGLAACARQAAGLDKIAAERNWKELHKLLSAPDPCEAVRAIATSGVLEMIVPRGNDTGLPGLVETERTADLTPDPMQRLMAMTARRDRDMTALTARLRLSNAELDRLANWADPSLPHVLVAGAPQTRAAIYRHGAEAVRDRAILEAAQGRDVGRLVDVLTLVQAWTVPDFPVGGEDALALGLKGKEIGDALDRVEASWIADDFQSSRDTLLARLKA